METKKEKCQACDLNAMVANGDGHICPACGNSMSRTEYLRAQLNVEEMHIIEQKRKLAEEEREIKRRNEEEIRYWKALECDQHKIDLMQEVGQMLVAKYPDIEFTGWNDRQSLWLWGAHHAYLTVNNIQCRVEIDSTVRNHRKIKFEVCGYYGREKLECHAIESNKGLKLESLLKRLDERINIAISRHDVREIKKQIKS